MRIKKCAICDTDYAPNAHFFHCPICGTLANKIGGHLRDYSTMKPIARGLSRFTITEPRLRNMAAVLLDDISI